MDSPAGTARGASVCLLSLDGLLGQTAHGRVCCCAHVCCVVDQVLAAASSRGNVTREQLWQAHPFGLPLLKHVIGAYESVGDCQTLAALTCVLRMGEISEVQPGGDDAVDAVAAFPHDLAVVAKVGSCILCRCNMSNCN